METIPNLPQKKQKLLAELVDRLGRVPNMAAIVLGGSYAAGTHGPASDMDVGLYYHEDRPFPIPAIRQVAGDVSSDGNPTVTDFYGWGPWVNGGAWIQTRAGKVDFLYRNLDQVERTIAEAVEGVHRQDYGQQPSFGFYSVAYLAETRICIPLEDPEGQIGRLKDRVKAYPPKLKERIVQDDLWSAEFTLLHARGFARRGDVYNTAGCLARIAANLTQVLFAVNEKYFLSDKKAMETIASFRIVPANYVEQVTGVLASPGKTAEEMAWSVDQIASVWRSVVALTGDYRSKFNL